MLVLYVVWGSTYLGIAVAVDTMPPFLMAAGRFGIAGACLLAWILVRERRRFVVPTLRELRDTAVVAALLLGGGLGLVTFGEQTVPSGITALMIGMMPVWVAVFGRLLFAERLPPIAVVGVVVGFVGVAILVGPTFGGGTGALEPVGLAAIVLSPICWASGSLFSSHRAVLPKQPLVATAVQMLAGSVVLAAMGVLSGELGRVDLAAVSPASWVAFAYLTVIGTFAFIAYVWLLRVAPLPLIATYAYVNPVVAVILGAIVLGEAIHLHTVVAGTVIVVAVALIVTARGRMRGPLPRRPERPEGDPEHEPVRVVSSAG